MLNYLVKINMANFNTLILMLVALLAGVSFVFQQAVNSNLRFEIGSAWWAGFFSYLGGSVVMLIMALLMREPFVSGNQVLKSSLWSWSGGIFGAIYIAISILLLPRLGIFTVVALIVVGQLLTSVVFDHFGVMNVPVQPLSFSRCVGAVFLIIGAGLIRW